MADKKDQKPAGSFEERRKHLAHMSDEELYNYFWELAGKIVDPLVQAGKIYTTPAIERSVLLRMGFSSLEAQALVQGVLEHQLLPHGAGNLVWKLSEALDLGVREAGLELIEGKHWDEAVKLFEGVTS
ncbi:MAG TPA: ornithine aminomutase subunit alpha [Clostridia bacterium]|nr:ornithine aminomutase subunit alpha [Clostridia bacterium]